MHNHNFSHSSTSIPNHTMHSSFTDLSADAHRRHMRHSSFTDSSANAHGRHMEDFDNHMRHSSFMDSPLHGHMGMDDHMRRMDDHRIPGMSVHENENLYQLLKRMYNNINELRLHKPLLSNELFIQKLRIGDHLISERQGGTYFHHGIYIGDNTVIHLQGPHSSAKHSNPCNICHYLPHKNGTVVKTCLDCFHCGHSFCVREYGIQISGDLIDEWILNKLDASMAIYTCRKGDIFIGKWTERKTVIHLISMKPGSASHYSSCENYSYMTSSSTLETCLKCFLNGGLLYINELELSVARCGGGDDWDSCRDKPIASVFRKLCGKPVDKVYEVWDSISSTRSGIKKMWKQLTAPSFIIYENQQIQICELASTKSPEQIVNTANQYLKHGFDNYNLLYNNCEHFATACKTGSRRSVQAENRNRMLTDKWIQHFLDECEPPSFIRPMETLDLYINQLRLHKSLLPNDLFIQKLRSGDHLIVNRPGGTFHHHGIFIGNNRVIHLQNSDSCIVRTPETCHKCCYKVPLPYNASVVLTCLDCFHGGDSFYVREYGIRFPSDPVCIRDVDDWILDKLNASGGVVYTCRTGDIYLGRWTNRNTVIHLIRAAERSATEFSNCEGYSYSPDTRRLETCIKCFLRLGGLLYIDELDLSVARGGYKGSGSRGDPRSDEWGSCQDKPIVSAFRKLCGERVERVDQVWDEISLKPPELQMRAPSFIIYGNQQFQICEIACTKSPYEIVNTARQYLEDGFGDYHRLSNNCEHFATYCKIRSRRSVQTEYENRDRNDKKTQRDIDSHDPPSYTNYRQMETLMDSYLPPLEPN